MKKHFAKLLLLGAMIVAGFSFVGCNDIEKELADLNNKVENLESESAKNLQDAINALNAKLASDYALKTDVSALEIALKGTIAEQVAVAEAKINKAIEDAIAACKAESADAIAKVAADLAKVSEELTAVAGDVKAATAKIDENAAAIAGVDAKVLELKGTIDALADYLDTLEGMARENKATLDSFAEYFAEYKGDVDMKLTELHGSLAALSVYLEELEASIDARFAEHQNTFLALSAFLEEHEIEVDAKFKEILGTFDALAAHLEEREAKIDFALEEINGTFAALSPVIETMQAQIKETHNTLEALADYLDEKEAETQLALEQLHGQLEALSPVVAEMQAKIEENHQTLLALSDFLEKADYQGQIDSLKADVAASIAMARELDQTLRFDLAAHIKTLEDQLAALEGGQVDLDAVKAEVNAVINQLVEDLTGRVDALENRVQIAFVPETVDNPVATAYESGDVTSPAIVVMNYQVTPAAKASKLTFELKGVAVKADAPEYFPVEVKVTDEAKGMIQVIGKIDTKSDAYKTAVKEANPHMALALSAVEEDVEIAASSFVIVDVQPVAELSKAVKFGVWDEDGEFVEATATPWTITTTVPYTTDPSVESKLFEDFAMTLNVAGEDVNLVRAAELLGIEIEVSYNPTSLTATYYNLPAITKYWKSTSTATANDIAAIDRTADDNKKLFDATCNINAAAVSYLNSTTGKNLTELIGKSESVEIKGKYIRINGELTNFAGVTGKYVIGGLDAVSSSLVINNSETLDADWTYKTYNEVLWEDITVEGGNIRDIFADAFNVTSLTSDVTAPASSYKVKDAEGNEVDNVALTISASAKNKLDVEIEQVAGKASMWDKTYVVEGEAVVEGETEEVADTKYTYTFTIVLGKAQADIEEDLASLGNAIAFVVPTNTYVDVTAADYDPETTTTKLPLGKLFTNLAANQAVAAIYPELTAAEKLAKLSGATWDMTIYEANDGVPTTTVIDAGNTSVKYVAATTTPAADESSYIALPYSQKLENLSNKEVVIEITSTIDGVNYTLATYGKFVQWAYKSTSPDQDMPVELVAVNTYSTVLSGTVPFQVSQNTAWRYYTIADGSNNKVYAATTADITANHLKEAAYNYWTVSGTASAYTFGDALTVNSVAVPNAVNLMKYFKIDVKDGQTYDPADYKIVVTPVTSAPEGATINDVPEIAFSRVATPTDYNYPIATNLYKADTDDDGNPIVVKGKFDINAFDLAGLYLDWNGFKSAAMSVKVTLYKNYSTATPAPQGSNVKCGEVTIGLSHPAIVSVPSTAPANAVIEVYYDDIDTTTGEVVQLAKGVRVFAANGTTPLYNLAATGWDDMFGNYVSPDAFASGTETLAYTNGADDDFFTTVYGLKANFVEILDENDVPTGEYEYTCSDSNFDDTTNQTDLVAFDEVNGTLTIKHDTNLHLNSDITFTIPVDVEHMFTYAGQRTEVKVVLKPGHKPAN